MKHYQFGVICLGGHGNGIPACGIVELTPEQYMYQLSKPDSGWICPTCGGFAEWDDDSFETNPSDEEE
jgi:hypothetical protein